MGIMVTYLAGVNHRPGARARLALLLSGEQLTLVPEPDNAYDKNAIAVYDGDMHLGYVPAIDAPAVKKALQTLQVIAIYTGRVSSTEITIKWE